MPRLSIKQPWHSLTSHQVLHLLNTNVQGLTTADAAVRLQDYGENQLPKPKPTSLLKKCLRQFNNVLIYILLIAATITGLLAQWLDTSVIIAVVFLNAIVGIIQEGKAEQALLKIRQMLHVNAQVYRNSELLTLPAEELVPGDVVVVKAGDKVPADIRLITSHNLSVNEAVLTGESLPREKSPDVVNRDAHLADRNSMIYSSTLLTHGRASGVVVATGKHTEVGRISQLLASAEDLITPLMRQMITFGRWLTLFIVIAAIATFCVGYYVRDYSVEQMFLAAISLAVAAIPEGLPAIMTITLAIGVTRMVSKHAIIRLLPAVDTMGSLTMICTDKTGTLTLNELIVQDMVSAQHYYHLENPHDHAPAKITINNQAINHHSDAGLQALAKAALLCNEQEHMNPVDEALYLFADRTGIDAAIIEQKHPTLAVLPFDSEKKFMASLHPTDDQQHIIYIKGAPELIIEQCRIDKDYWHKALENLTQQGKRVLALAYKIQPGSDCSLSTEAIDQQFVMLGLLGLIDPPRPDAEAAVADCYSAGIDVKMITGDHPATAIAVAKLIGMQHGGEYLTGDDLDKLDDQQLLEKIEDIDIFARTTPKHKIRLVKLLQQKGHIVAMTGDGVNDAPAVQQANIGIAMGIKGTEVTKDAAEMVLADDNFATIRDAIKEGRTVYDNLLKAILFILPTSFAEAFIIIAAIMTGMVLPITPLQILWINMVTTVTLALALGFEKAEPDIMQRKPRPTNQSLLSGFLFWRITFVSGLFLLGIFSIFFYYQANVMLDSARTVTVNAIVLAESFYLFNCRYMTAKQFIRKDLFSFKPALIAFSLVIVLQLIFTYLPFMQLLFKTQAMSIMQWLIAIVFAMSVFLIIQLEKRFTRAGQIS